MSRVNFTGRQRITHNRVDVVGSFVEKEPHASVTVDLTGLVLPPQARIVVEFYRSTSLLRFPAGIASRPQPVTSDLQAFGAPQGVLVRVKVIGTGQEDHGRLLAVADKVRVAWPEVPGRPESLLSFRAAEDMGALLWDVELGDDPVVLVNAKLDDWNGFARSSAFIALVYPEVLRRVGAWLASGEAEDEGPTADWDRFFTDMTSTPTPFGADDDVVDDWLRIAAGRFADRFDLLNRLQSQTHGGQE